MAIRNVCVSASKRKSCTKEALNRALTTSHFWHILAITTSLTFVHQDGLPMAANPNTANDNISFTIAESNHGFGSSAEASLRFISGDLT
jgi:hypothetical protein